MWKRRLFFSLLFVLGTFVAVFGWLTDGAKHKFRYLALAGHAVQVVGIFGSMLTPDREEHLEGYKESFAPDRKEPVEEEL